MFAALKRRRRVRTLVPLTVAALVAGYLVVTTLTASAATQLLSQGKTATSSSTENAGTPASSAVDGNAGTRWSSAFSDPQWIQVDLGGSATISQVVLQWEAAYATAFQIQVSSDGAAWTNVYSTTTGTGGTQTLAVSGTGRYVRMYGTARVTAYGYSLWELQVLVIGTPPTTGTTTTSPPAGCPWVGSTAPVATRVSQLLSRMTTDQKISILHGNGASSPYIGNLTGIASLCIPDMASRTGPAASATAWAA
jgi:beta-glucosidase